MAAVSALCLSCLLLAPDSAHALDPNIHLTQYIHKSWKIQDGSVADRMLSITQTSDGFLWFASLSQGIYRFDGVKFFPQRLFIDGRSINRVDSVYGDHAGGLWAVTDGKEIIHLKNGAVVSHFEFEGFPISAGFSEDVDGSLWIMLGNPRIDEILCHVTDRTLKCFGRTDGISIPGGGALASDGKGGFWLGGQKAIEHWREGVSQVYAIKALNSNGGVPVQTLILDPDGSTLWVGLLQQGPGAGLGKLQNGVFKSFIAAGLNGSKIAVSAMIRDRDGSLWVGTTGDGLFRIRGNVVDHYGRAEGLSGDNVDNLLEDREGIVWATTQNGIDSFREPRVTTFSALEGLGPDAAIGVLASKDGSVWVANGNSLDHIEKNGTVSSIRWGQGLPGDQVSAMLEDHAGNLWIGVGDDLYLLKNGHFRRIPESDHQLLGIISRMTEDVDGNIWAQCSGKTRKTIRIRDFKIREEFSNSQLPVGRIAADPHGGIWIGRPKELLLFRHGELQAFPIETAEINHLIVQADSSVLVAVDDGLAGLRRGKFQRMTAKNGLPCNEVFSLVEDTQKRWWAYTDRGVVEFADSELQRWWANPDAIIRTKLYDALDGARPGRRSLNPVALSSDGRIWFVNAGIVEMLDTSKPSRKALSAATYLESITVDRREFQASDNLKLSPRPRELQIDYTSPVLAVPERVRFRYRLDPYDRDWHDAGTRRHAFYTDLPPGKYSFRVVACDSDGVWNNSPAKLDFSVAPAYYQTNWFRVLCAAVLLAFAWTAYHRRVRQLALQFDLALDARVAERTRIGRELHDTLLQSFQGVLLKFQSVLKVLPERPIEAKQRLERALESYWCHYRGKRCRTGIALVSAQHRRFG